ncbi:MAG TPA: hypothetical protein VEY30_04805, partial [Myxococcaceae bacterium]|nr:hypothetical protein [Myxococcaceae bacterium]
MTLPRAVVQSLLMSFLVARVAVADSTVTSTPVSQAQALPLDDRGTSSVHIVKVADLRITSNAQFGFTLTVTSGSFAKADARTPIPFQVVTVAAGAAAPTAAAFAGPAGQPH